MRMRRWIRRALASARRDVHRDNIPATLELVFVDLQACIAEVVVVEANGRDYVITGHVSGSLFVSVFSPCGFDANIAPRSVGAMCHIVLCHFLRMWKVWLL